MSYRNRTISLEQKQIDWLNEQPRSFNLSEKIREFLNGLIETQSSGETVNEKSTAN